MMLSQMSAGAIDLMERFSSPLVNRHGLKVQWFEPWHPILDDALQELPETETCPHELFRMLMLNPGPMRKRTALVTEKGRPVAIIGLWRLGRHWRLIGDGAVPHATAPAQEGYLFRALAVLGVDIRIEYWENGAPPLSAVRNAAPMPIYRLDCRADVERYWRTMGHHKSVRRARNHTKGFTFTIDEPGSLAWIVRNWGEKWSDDPSEEALRASDIVLAGEYLQRAGRYHSFLLKDGEIPAAGWTFFVYGGDLTSQTTYYESRYEAHGAGTRCLDLTFQWAAEAGYGKVDLGGGLRYKERWAPEDGQIWAFNVCPAYLHTAKRFLQRGRRLAQALSGLRRGPSISRPARSERVEEARP